MVSNSLSTEMTMRETIKRINSMEEENISGKMVQFTKEISRNIIWKGRDSGNLQMATHMRENIVVALNMVLVSIKVVMTEFSREDLRKEK